MFRLLHVRQKGRRVPRKTYFEIQKLKKESGEVLEETPPYTSPLTAPYVDTIICV